MEKYIALRVKCPICKNSLMDPYHQIRGKASISLTYKVDEKTGKIHLCPFYGCYDHDASFPIPEKAVVEFFCPHCEEELISENKCRECGAPMIPVSLEKGGRINFCSRKGCELHFLEFENVSDALRKMYNEYGYF